jgi:hypothetical protein
MASRNVEKMLKTLRDDRVLTAEFSLLLVKLEAAANVTPTPDERKDFFKELIDLMSRQPFGWIT